VVECFVTYLAGHNRPIHEVLFGNEKSIAAEYRNNFVGMTTEPVDFATLEAARTRLRTELPRRLTRNHREFLIGLSRAVPDWSLLSCSHALELPALKWKLANLETFRTRQPTRSQEQTRILQERPEP
jgi:hypothetical protein